MPRATGTSFALAACAYWCGVYPRVVRELRHWRTRAAAIEDPLLREQALAALDKRGNMEGAAAFATFAPRAMRARVVRATVAFQAAYNHLDVLSEQPAFARAGGHVQAGGRSLEEAARLHGALVEALGWGADLDSMGAGYLAALVQTCREAVDGLPGWAVVRPVARLAAERVIGFQAHQAIPPAPCGEERIAAWASGLTPAGADLRWWEAAAAAGSSLGVHAAIALAATPGVTEADARDLHDAYFPWIGALHSLLDHLVDAAEDARDGQRNLIACYASREQAAERMGLLADRALAAARTLPAGPREHTPSGPRRAHRHELVVAAMASFYLADPCAHTPEAAPIAQAVFERFGALAKGPMAVFRARAGVGRVCRPARAAMSLPYGIEPGGASQIDSNCMTSASVS